VSWRVGLIDSCGIWPRAADAAAFASVSLDVERRPPATDPTGHGSRIAGLLTADDGSIQLLLGQVFVRAEPASAAAVAAAIDWAVYRGATLIHLSLGIRADRPVLRAAVSRALDSKVIVVASTPARGAPVYPAAYQGVIRGTGDARCAPGVLSCLAPRLFGGCPRLADLPLAERVRGDAVDPVGRGGASAGAAWVSKAILQLADGTRADAAAEALTARAAFHGPERRASER
jgi:hypothetical protein